MDPEVIADYANIVGEGPTWNRLDNKLYWIDIMAGRIFHYDPVAGEHEEFYQGPILGGFTVQEDGSLLLFMEKGAVGVLREGKLSYMIDELPGEQENRFNDIIADPAGRVFCGTMPLDGARIGDRLGSLYRLDTDGSTTKLLDGIGISNGLGFTTDRKQMYYTDSVEHSIYLFDYDVETGSISNRRVFVATPDEPGVPDGMTVDAEGYVWSARAGGSVVNRYTPEGVEERTIRLPVKIISSVAFGGADLTDIYVTTIGGDKKDEEGPLAGALFRLQLGIKGLPEFFSRVSF